MLPPIMFSLNFSLTQREMKGLVVVRAQWVRPLDSKSKGLESSPTKSRALVLLFPKNADGHCKSVLVKYKKVLMIKNATNSIWDQCCYLETDGAIWHLDLQLRQGSLIEMNYLIEKYFSFPFSPT